MSWCAGKPYRLLHGCVESLQPYLRSLRPPGRDHRPMERAGTRRALSSPLAWQHGTRILCPEDSLTQAGAVSRQRAGRRFDRAAISSSPAIKQGASLLKRPDHGEPRNRHRIGLPAACMLRDAQPVPLSCHPPTTSCWLDMRWLDEQMPETFLLSGRCYKMYMQRCWVLSS